MPGPVLSSALRALATAIALTLACAGGANAQLPAGVGTASWKAFAEEIEAARRGTREMEKIGESVKAMSRSVADDDLPTARRIARELLDSPGHMDLVLNRDLVLWEDEFASKRILNEWFASAVNLNRDEIERLLHCGDPDVAIATLTVITATGEAGAPHLGAVRRLSASEKTPRRVRERAARCLLTATPEGQAALNRQSVGPFLGTYWGVEELSDELSEAEADALAAMPDESRYMGAGLVVEGLFRELLSSGHTRSEVPALLHAARHGTRDERVLALALLSRLNREAAPAADGLSAYLKTERDPFLRELAAGALIMVRCEPAKIEAVADRLAFADAAERAEFVTDSREALEAIAQEQRDMVEYLLERPSSLTTRLSEGVAHSDLRWLLRGLKLVRPDLPPDAARAIEKLTTHKDADVRRLAAEFLEPTGAAAADLSDRSP